MKQSSIVLNGTRYNTKTGEVVGGKPVKKYIDGFMRPSSVKPLTATKAAVAKAKRALPIPSRVPSSNRTANSIHQRQQKGKVLLRKAVKAPVKKQAPPKPEARKVATASPILARAKAVPKSDKITRFAPVRAAAVTSPTKTKAPQEAKPAKAQLSPQAKKDLSPKEKLLSEALAKADTHKQKPPKQKNKAHKHFKLAASVIAGMAVLLYVIYLNAPNLAMKVAAVRAGFSADLPNYTPGGYRLAGPIAYSPGQITIGYTSNTDDRAYSINQKQSAWDSESLLTNFVTNQADYQTYRDHGLTIYMYGDSNATWVNAGVWYTIDGKAQLSAEQIIKIAASL